jgi:archaellum biogenesis ATPase FlaH
MSKTSDDFESLQKEESELRVKRKEIEKIEIESKHDYLVKARREVDSIKGISLIDTGSGYIDQILERQRQYMDSAKHAMRFLTKEFDGVVPYFGKNIILIGASTGEGKSTTTANLILKNLVQGKRTLIITNEEAAGDVINRVACLTKGWNYTNHDQITDEQKAFFEEFARKTQKYITVVEDTYKDPRTGETHMGVTTTVEGVTGLLHSLIRDSLHYDAIVIDYIQKISRFKMRPNAKEWEAMNSMIYEIDNFKNLYMSPVVVFAQLHNSSQNDETTFEQRLRGCKGIIVPVTCALEMKADKKGLKTEWIVHKSRWYSDKIDGQGFMTGWYKGLYVSLDNPEYQKWAKQKQVDRINRTMEAAYGKPRSDGSGKPGGTGTESESVSRVDTADVPGKTGNENSQ